MIREFQRDDINKVADIWLDTNIKAHNFIPAEYWKSNFKSVKEALLLAEVYVYEYDTEIQGFIGLNDEYVEGIFVSGEMQSQGIGAHKSQETPLQFVVAKIIRIKVLVNDLLSCQNASERADLFVVRN